MFKKLISLMMSVMIICGLVSSTVNADAPLYFDGITTNVFDVDFGDIDSASDAPEFTFDGSWDYAGEFVALPGTKNGSVKTKNNIDLTGAYGYEFSTEAIITQNAMIMYLAYSTTNLSGYRVVISRKNGNLTVYKADGSVLKADGSETDAVSVSTSYGVATVWTAKLEDKTLIIRKGSTEVFKGTDTQAPGLNGKFGVESSAIENFAVLDMKLDKLGNGTTVNDWRYEKKFSAKDTQESLAADGITLSRSYGVISFSNTYGIVFSPNSDGENKNVRFRYDKKLSGDYTVQLSYKSNNANDSSIRFNEKDSDNYYDIQYKIKSTTSEPGYAYSIRKITAGKAEVVPVTPIVSSEETEAGTTEEIKYATAEMASTSTTVTHVIQVKDNGDETITLTATAYKGQNTTTETAELATVSATIKKEDLYVQDCNKVHIYMAAPGSHFRIYNFAAYSTPSGETKTKDVVLLNKSFETGDTTESLAQVGITYDAAPVSITTRTDGLGAYKNASQVSDGMRWGSTSSTVTYDDTLSGDYTIEATTRTYQNSTKFYINHTSSTKHYEVLSNSSKGIVYIYDGSSGSSSNLKSQSTALSNNFKGYGCKTTINVKNNPDKSITITATITSYRDNKSTSCEYTDTGSPYTSGKLQIYADKNTTYHTIYDLKITKHETYAVDGDYSGVFYIDGEEATSYEKGAIYFETTVMDLGTYTVVAALYEDNEMTGLKTFTPREIYEGKVKLFDTTSSTAATGEVKVFFLDSGDTLNKTMEVWNLK